MDVDPGDIEPGSWRHANATFGVDFTRHAMVRHFNLGVARADRPANDLFAGEETRIGPFYTCVSCGGTTIGQASRTRPSRSAGQLGYEPAQPPPALVPAATRTGSATTPS